MDFGEMFHGRLIFFFFFFGFFLGNSVGLGPS